MISLAKKACFDSPVLIWLTGNWEKARNVFGFSFQGMWQSISTEFSVLGVLAFEPISLG